jgi:hypothetical protein
MGTQRWTLVLMLSFSPWDHQARPRSSGAPRTGLTGPRAICAPRGCVEALSVRLSVPCLSGPDLIGSPKAKHGSF